MQSITKDYLIDIISRKISSNIQQYRKQNPHSLNLTLYPSATANEVHEFISSIPYFDARLKNFLMSNNEEQTIISQKWELEFAKKCELWAKSYEWMYGKPNVLNGHHVYKNDKENLSLPY
ncbi:MAG: hypothetical protein V4685_12795 [Bacteroidota bacterium]